MPHKETRVEEFLIDSGTLFQTLKDSCSDQDVVCVDDSGGPRETPAAHSGPL